MATFAAAYATKERLARSMLHHPKVHGIGVGYRDPKHREKGAAVIVYADALSAASLGIPTAVSTHLKGREVRVPIRFVKSGAFRSHAKYRSRIRPVPAGYSIGTTRRSGTAGLIVTNFPEQNKRYILSNNHVLTNPVNSSNRTATLQPGGADKGRRKRDRVGHLELLVKLSRNGINYMDVALSAPTRNSILNPRYAAIGIVPGHVTSYRVGEQWKKVGRTTGFRTGIVDSVNTDVRVGYGRAGSFRFRNQTVVVGSKPVSQPGDSGSVWLRREDNFAAAVNFAGSTDGKSSISFPIHWAMETFGIRAARPDGTGVVCSLKTGDGNPAYSRQLTAKELASIRIVKAPSVPSRT